jgi:uncharacterized membrane protein
MKKSLKKAVAFERTIEDAVEGNRVMRSIEKTFSCTVYFIFGFFIAILVFREGKSAMEFAVQSLENNLLNNSLIVSILSFALSFFYVSLFLSVLCTAFIVFFITKKYYEVGKWQK